MSKFEHASFYGGYDTVAINKQKYTKEEAIEIAKKDYFWQEKGYIAVGSAYVRHRAGVNEDSEPCVGWWLEYSCYPRSCPCWVFHWTNSKDEHFSNDYEYIELNKIYW